MLTKDLLRVSRAGGGYRPQFAGADDRDLAARVIGAYQGHVGEPRATLEASLEGIEHDAADFKLVRGFAKLLEREATFETHAAVEPERARVAAFTAAESLGVVTTTERDAALDATAERLGAAPSEIDRSLYADLDERQMLAAVDVPWSPDKLLDRYNLSLAQTALFDATAVTIRSADPKALVSAVKRLGLMYEVRRTDDGRVVDVTGPDALFRDTRRYGTRFARLLRTVVSAPEWRLEATIDDRGTERELVLTHEDSLSPPGDEPVAAVRFDSGIEADFANRFEALGLDWTLVREPEPLAAGARVMIPDFAFEYAHADFRVFFEIVGFWTPDYVEKKLDQLDRVEDVDLIVAVDSSLGVTEEIAVRDHRVVPYEGRVHVKDVRDVLREFEDELIADAAAGLPDELRPASAVVTLEALAAEHGVSEAALSDLDFPEHRLIGRTLVQPRVLAEIGDALEPEMDLVAAESILDEWGLSDASATLAALGYRVEWAGLGGGTLKVRASGDDPSGPAT